jgi:hypothetical protein
MVRPCSSRRKRFQREYALDFEAAKIELQRLELLARPNAAKRFFPCLQFVVSWLRHGKHLESI